MSKKLYTLSFAALFLTAGSSFAQTFTYTNISAAQYGAPAVELIFGSTLINSTSSTLTLRVTRQQDVMPDAPTWTSAFCMDVCYLPTTDSVTYSFAPMDTVDFTFHMYTSATADHASAMMRWKNTATPSNTFNQTFFGSTDGSFAGVNDLNTPAASVSMYPMPAVAGDVFTMSVETTQPAVAPLSLVVYNMYGSVVSTTPVIAGINLMSLDLPTGIYSYSLVSDGSTVLNSGKLSMIK